MNQSLRENKNTIRNFMREHYPDERLAMLLAHAQSGKLAFDSCCCFLGVLNATHALAGVNERILPDYLHHHRIRLLSGADEAEHAYSCLGNGEVGAQYDAMRRRLLIPMVRAEQKRRDLLKAKAHAETEVESLQNV
jgi:hypothetical protein